MTPSAANVRVLPSPERTESSMPRDSRIGLIQEIEKLRNSRVIVAVWGDRQNLPTVIASDSHPVFFHHLQELGDVERIDVLLYTTGGQTLAAWGLANLVREYCKEMAVIVPHRALSAGTLFTLSANEILMTRLGQLSPIDPSVASPLGPAVQVPGQIGQQRVVPVSVEDAVGFLELARQEAGLREEQSSLSVFERLASQVHPLALGAVYRSRQQIKMLADRLLATHMPGEERSKDRNRIVQTLTRELGSHDYLVGRAEAKDHLGLNIVDTPAGLEEKILKLFKEYEVLLQIRVPYNPDGFLGSNNVATGDFDRAIIESTDLTHVFRTTKKVERIQAGQQGLQAQFAAIQEIVTFEGWVIDTNV